MSTQIHPSLLLRKIIHFDMDAFYASIEIRDDPTLKGKPVVVGGPPNSRAVVTTASYEARKFGIHSAMPCSKAARLCPDAIFVKPNFEKYTVASAQIREVFRQYTTIIEPLSLDEAYLDVTHNEQGLYAVKIAKLIQEEIFETLHITGSAGVAPNKLLAKIASDIRKPNGITVVLPNQAQEFMGPLPLRRIHGIGPVTERKLADVGLNLCCDVWQHSMAELEAKVGNMVMWLYERSRGLDTRPVQSSWVRKSLGREETFSKDILNLDVLATELAAIVTTVASDLKDRNLKGRTITIKVRYADFKRITRSHSIAEATCDERLIADLAAGLLRSTEAGQRKIRLLGVSISNLERQSIR